MKRGDGRHTRGVISFLTAALVAAPAAAQDRATASAADIRAEAESLGREMKPGQGFAMRRLLAAGGREAALEYWTAPGRPAVHPDEAEYATVVAGAGTLEWGGRMTAERTTRPGLVEGDGIEGGRMRALSPGDVILIPAGVPHRFGIDRAGRGGRLVLLGMKLPR